MSKQLLSITNVKIAFAHISSRIKQTIVAVLSVTFGISMYIFMNGFMSGVNQTQSDLAFSTLAHIRIYHDLPEDRTNILQHTEGEEVITHIRNAKVIQYTEGIKNAEKYIHILNQTPQVEVVAPEVNINVFFRNGSLKINGILNGIDPEQEDAVFHTADYLYSGSWNEIKHRSDGIVLGKGLARKLSLNLNDKVIVSTAEGVTKHFTIIGITETTLASVDNTQAYVRISTARQMLSENMSYVTDLQANISDYNQAAVLAQQLNRSIPYKVESWQEANGQLMAANTLRNIIAVAVSLTILLVAGFGIYNIMNMTVNEKIREIAILKAMGFDGKDIVQIFLTQSVIIGIIGGLIGLLLGYGISVLVDHVPFKIATLENLPMTYYSMDYVLAFFFGLITTFIAGYLPSKKASKVDPVDIIRG